MLNRKLLEVLSHLTAAGKKRLRQFLASPYFNSTSNAESIVRLYDLIIRYDAAENHPALSKKAVFQIFFPEKQFQENSKSPLDALTSELFKLVRRFLAQSEMEQENGEVQEYLALARFYRKFAFEERFWHTMQVLRKHQNDSPLRDTQYFFNQFKIEEEEVTFRGLHNSFEDDANLNSMHRYLDLYYSILKLESACALIYQKRIAPVEISSSSLLTESVIRLAEEGGPLDIPVNRIYYLLLNLLQKSADGEELVFLENFLDRNEEQINVEKFKSLKAYIRFLSVQVYLKSGDGASLRATFGIYKDHLERGYFYYDGLIQFHTFRNLVVLGLKLGEFNWVKKFLDTHSPERICGTRYPMEVHSLNLAEYYFYLKEYEKAQENLIYRHFENPTVSILADVLLVKIYFETKSELLDPRMKALDQKIRRSKLNREVKSRYFNFLKKLDKIIKYCNQTKSPKRAQLVEEIKTTQEIIAREWLLEKLGVM